MFNVAYRQYVKRLSARRPDNYYNSFLSLPEKSEPFTPLHFKNDGRLKVLFLSYGDYAGSGYQLSQALNSTGAAESFIAAYQKTTLGYPLDLYLCGKNQINNCQELIEQADIIHFKGDHLPRKKNFKGLSFSHKNKIITAGGSGFRRKNEEVKKQTGHLGWHPIDEYRKRVSRITALTPDLMYEEDIKWIPHAYPINKYIWKDPMENWTSFSIETIRIAHSPSSRHKKGTDSVFLPMIELLNKMGYFENFKIEPMLIEKVDNKTCLEMKKSAHLFFDQALIPAYGISAVEAMSYGIPVVNYLPKHIRERDKRLANCPVIALEEPSPDEAANKVFRVIKEKRLKELSEKTYSYFKNTHSYEVIGKQLLSLYRETFKEAYWVKWATKTELSLNDLVPEHIELLRQYINDDSLLEIGCGYGRLLQYFPTAVGIDSLEARINVCKQQLSNKVECMRAEKITYTDKSFSQSFTCQFLMHVPSEYIEKIISEICRVTKDKIVCIEHYEKNSEVKYNHYLPDYFSKFGFNCTEEKKLSSYPNQRIFVFKNV